MDSEAAGRRRPVVMAVATAALGVALLLAYLSLAAGAELEAPTFALAVAGVALVFCLRALYEVTRALGRPGVQTVVEREGVAATASRREAREERRRVLRALKELDFDHAMGKISDEDYGQVREGYQLRAVEVMRTLEVQPTVHPELEARLRGREQRSTSDGLICSGCDGLNDRDAKFCKHCGKALGG